MEQTASKLFDLELELMSTDWIIEKARASRVYSQNLYATLCNNQFVKNDVWPVLQDDRWSCSWRYAGGIIADMREEGDYLNWYCSGIRGTIDMGGSAPELHEGYVGEGHVTEEIRNDLLKLGWIVIEDDSQPV